MIIRTGALVMSKLRDALGMGSPEFVCLNEDYLEETIEFATRVFVKSEPLTVHLKVTMDEARPLMAAVCNAALTDKTGFLAVDPDSKRVVAFLMAKDFTTPLAGEFAPRLAPIFHMLGLMEEELLRSRSVKRGEVCHVFIVGASSFRAPRNRVVRFLSRGRLALQLARAAKDFLRMVGYRKLYCECTHAGSQRLPALFPHRVVSEIRYADYVFPGTGEKAFEGIPHEKCVAYLVDN
jgi:hypothetical protein